MVARFARAATHNPDSDVVVLGLYRKTGISYDRFAEERGRTYFSADNWSQLESMGIADDVNIAFLDQQRNKTFMLIDNPSAPGTGGFLNEVNWLARNGYKVERFGEFWRATK